MDQQNKTTEPINPNTGSPCQHESFEVSCNVSRLSEEEGGGISHFQADIKLKCHDCNLPFRFLGLDRGVSFRRPMIDTEALELRAPIAPGPSPAENVHHVFEVSGESIRAAQVADEGLE